MTIQLRKTSNHLSTIHWRCWSELLPSLLRYHLSSLPIRWWSKLYNILLLQFAITIANLEHQYDLFLLCVLHGHQYWFCHLRWSYFIGIPFL